jgi:hypothetical protein
LPLATNLGGGIPKIVLYGASWMPLSSIGLFEETLKYTPGSPGIIYLAVSNSNPRYTGKYRLVIERTATRARPNFASPLEPFWPAGAAIPTPTPVLFPTAVPTPVPTAVPAPTPGPTPTITPTPTAIAPTPTPVPTATAVPTPTPSPSPGILTTSPATVGPGETIYISGTNFTPYGRLYSVTVAGVSITWTGSNCNGPPVSSQYIDANGSFMIYLCVPDTSATRQAGEHSIVVTEATIASVTGQVDFTTPGYVTDLQIYICNEAIEYGCFYSGSTTEGGGSYTGSNTDPQPLDTCIGVFAWTLDRHSRPTWFSQIDWLTNGSLGFGGANGFRINAEYFGFQLGSNTLTATVTNPNSGQLLTTEMQLTFDSSVSYGCP